MRRPRLEISAGGVLLLAALIFVLTADELTALALAVLAHEAGHAAAIYLTGGRVTALRLAVTGPVICRTGGTDGAREAFCALAGPLAGVLYAIVSAERLPLSAGMSLVLSAFNSLPALPLDGGRALAALAGERAAGTVSFFASAALLIAGTALAAAGFGFAALIAGAALCLMQWR